MASSLVSTPCPEAKRAGAQYYAPHPSAAGPKDEQRLKAQQGHAVPPQHQQPETRNPAQAASARLQHPTTARRPASTAFAAGFSRIENTSSGDGAGAGVLPSAARKKSSFTASVSGEENRQPQLRTRVPAPPATPPVAVAVVPTVPPRSIRPTVTVVAQPSRATSRESTPLRPLVVKKRTSLVHAAGSLQGDSRIRSAAAAGAPLGFPAAIKALVEDIDCFAKGWTEMFDGLSAGADGPEGRPSKLGSFACIHPSAQPENAGTCLADGPGMEKRMHEFLLPVPLGSTGSVSALQASLLVSTDGETAHIDINPVHIAH